MCIGCFHRGGFWGLYWCVLLCQLCIAVGYLLQCVLKASLDNCVLKVAFRDCVIFLPCVPDVRDVHWQGASVMDGKAICGGLWLAIFPGPNAVLTFIFVDFLIFLIFAPPLRLIRKSCLLLVENCGILPHQLQLLPFCLCLRDLCFIWKSVCQM